MPFKKGNNKAARKTVSAESLKAYKRAERGARGARSARSDDGAERGARSDDGTERGARGARSARPPRSEATRIYLSI